VFEDERPWQTDRELTLEDARKAIQTQFPSVDTAELRYLASGWEFDAYLTRDGWVFRFPRRAESAEFFEREARVHELVLQHMPARIAIRRIELLGEPSASFPYRFGGHRFIPGVSADEISADMHHALARDVAVAFNALHAIPESLAHERGLAGKSYDDLESADWFEQGKRVAGNLEGGDPVVDEAISWFMAQILPLPSYSGPLRFIHCDLAAEHLIADGATGHLQGIIDWTDAMLGDPVRDFVALVPALGWTFTDIVLQHYAHPVNEAFLERLRVLARVLSVMWLTEAHERGGDVQKHRQWVRRAFAR
jgi:aminoglycoside phosphotransferase (APT) family kinase protein